MPQGFVDQDIPGGRMGDGFTGRIVDPVTGGGLFNPDLDYDSVGIDPLTGLNAPIGTDIGFSAPIRRFLATGIYNGDFSLPPPDVSQPIKSGEESGSNDDANYNPLPNWHLTSAASGRITCQAIVDASSASGYVLRWTIESGCPSGEDAYIQTLAPVTSSRGLTFFDVLATYWLAATRTDTDFIRYVQGQYLTRDLSTTGTSDLTSGTMTTSAVSIVDTATNAGVTPGDAAYIRIRVGVKANAANTGAALTTDLAEVAQILRNISAYSLTADAVTAAAIAAGTITATEIASGAITTDKLAAGAVTAAKITAGTITATELASDSVTTRAP